MLKRLVWLFDEHRRLRDEKVQMEKDFAVMMEKYLRTDEDNKKLSALLEETQKYIANNPAGLDGLLSQFQKYQEQALQDMPYPDGKIPDDVWLTPGTGEPVRDA